MPDETNHSPPNAPFRKSYMCTLWFWLNMEEVSTLTEDPACLYAGYYGDLLLTPEQASPIPRLFFGELAATWPLSLSVRIS